jgi:peptidoglycan/xylan/chitin deacetylase (PgdA/CDA1 family)
MPRPSERRRLPAPILLLALLLAGCAAAPLPASAPAPLEGTDYRLVYPLPGETYANLAARHLGDPARGESLRRFNGQPHPDDAPVIVVPKRPYPAGGFGPDGYQTVPVLAYPAIAAAGGAGRMAAALFQRHLQFLQRNGYAVVGLERLLAFMRLEEALPSRAVVLTFADSSQDFYRHAFPHLAAAGLPATLFVAVDRAGRGQDLTWEQLRELQAQGVSVQVQGRGAGGWGRPQANETFEAAVRRLVQELRDDRRTLAAQLGRPPGMLAHPPGKASPLATAFAAQTGYRALLVRGEGANPFFADPFQLVQQPVPSDAPPESLERLLTVFVREAAP